MNTVINYKGLTLLDLDYLYSHYLYVCLNSPDMIQKQIAFSVTASISSEYLRRYEEVN